MCGRVVIQSPIGYVTCIFMDQALSAIDITQQGKATAVDDMPDYGGVCIRELEAYLRGRLRRFSMPFRFPQGTAFQQKVWRTLLTIPYGETRSYGWLAAAVGSPRAARAVGQAVGRNPLPIIIPCHRIISADGSLGGFSCGVSVKKWLLKLEQTGIGR